MTGRRRPNRGRPAPNRAGGGRPSNGTEFWGDPEAPPPGTVGKIRPTDDPGALVRSLGDPPLATNPAAAEHHLAVVYEEAVRAATALAAANGLLAEHDDVEPDAGDT